MSTIVTRAGKGSALTHNEVDANFTNLNTDKLQSGNTAAALTITTATIAGGTIDNTTVGATTPAAGTFTDLTANNSAIISGNVIVGSGEGTATPVGNILRAPDAVGTNIAGADLEIKPGASTGSANGGNISFYSSALPGASGTTTNTLTERMRIISTGAAADSPAGVAISVIGVYPSAVPITGNGDKINALTIHGTNEATAAVGIINWGSSSADEPNLNFMSINSGTVGNFGTVPVSGTNLGNITFEGYSGSGSNMLVGAAIFVEAAGTWTSTNAPTILRFQTATATSGLASRIAIDENLVYVATNTGFQISETAVTTGSSAIGNVFSGTYTPTLTNVTNVAASTAYQCQYMRVGNVVTVSGRVNIDATTTSTNTTLGVSLPIASNFASAQNAGGSFAPSAAALSTSGVVFADTTNDRASFRILIDSAAANDYYFMFTYLVI